MTGRWLGLGAASGFLLLAAMVPSNAQTRFDLRDWARKPLSDSTTLLLECNADKVCGEGSSVSARQIVRPKEPLTVERQRASEQASAKRLKEESEGRIKEIEIGETRETLVEGLPLVYTERRIVRTKGAAQTVLSGVMVGKTRAYRVIASGETAAQVRSNFQGFARIVALILGELAVEAPKSETPSRSP